MTSHRRPRSSLHLQLGQEVIYLLLTLFVMATLILAAVAMRQHRDIGQLRKEIGAKDSILQGYIERVADLERQLARLTHQMSKEPGGRDLALVITGLTDDLKKRDEELRGARTRIVQLDQDLRELRLLLVSRDSDRAQLSDCRGQLATAQGERDAHQLARQQCDGKLAEAQRELERLRRLSDKPPVITLQEEAGFRFSPGKAALTDAFRQQLTGKIDEILAHATRYGTKVIEVIGHTDEQPMPPAASNLDPLLLPALLGKFPVASLTAADNAGMGLIRAAAVARALREDSRLQQGFEILVLSAGQTIDTSDRLAAPATPQDVAERRRIVIRVRKPAE